MSENILDLKEFLERVQDDKELLVELLGIYEEDYIKKRIQLEKAFKENNHEEVKNIAHSLKGASGNISAKNLRVIFLQLEEMGKNKSFSGFETILAQIDQQFGLLKLRMEEIKKELGS
jgi:HPt (histidine-containing phosphotransfer) domain-containing protein